MGALLDAQEAGAGVNRWESERVEVPISIRPLTDPGIGSTVPGQNPRAEKG